jgi:Resolvase, N terminal domain
LRLPVSTVGDPALMQVGVVGKLLLVSPSSWRRALTAMPRAALATNMNRPELQQMLAELGALRPTYVIFYDLSRVARDEFDAFCLLRKIDGCGAKLESTLERVDDSSTGKRPREPANPGVTGLRQLSGWPQIRPRLALDTAPRSQSNSKEQRCPSRFSSQ